MMTRMTECTVEVVVGMMISGGGSCGGRGRVRTAAYDCGSSSPPFANVTRHGVLRR